MEQVVEELNIAEPSERSTDQFNELKYIFIDDPVSSLDENHLIELAVDIVQLIKSSESELKFIITTHNPIFYNVLYNELRSNKKVEYAKYLLIKDDSGDYSLKKQGDDSPFLYHLHLKMEIQNAIKNNNIKKYHFNFLRNILEKTSTFLGYESWSDLLPDSPNPKDETRKNYEKMILNFSSHSKHSADEISEMNERDKIALKRLIEEINKTYGFKI